MREDNKYNKVDDVIDHSITLSLKGFSSVQPTILHSLRILSLSRTNQLYQGIYYT